MGVVRVGLNSEQPHVRVKVRRGTWKSLPQTASCCTWRVQAEGKSEEAFHRLPLAGPVARWGSHGFWGLKSREVGAAGAR
jgi:hypothetical protein